MFSTRQGRCFDSSQLKITLHADYFSALVGHTVFYTRAVLLILRDFNEPKDHSEFIWINGLLDGWVDVV